MLDTSAGYTPLEPNITTTANDSARLIMKAISNSLILYRLAGMLLLCLALPPLLCAFVGPGSGALSAVAAGALWFSQYRRPAWDKSGSGFWFVIGGYVLIGITLLGSLGRLLGVSF